ncbi:GFA family protein [Pulveribacter sp.]|uniref:GFA family protein n=1 Tax=Pulveribacter sp. TaxID=2678893 RepID=UPI0028ABFB20|nr:GFA family protein [Pulveribacter sp.]
MQYHGSCHCGQIAFEVEGDAIAQAMACNCSICSRKGSLLWFVPRERLALRTDAARMATYTFHKHVIQHHFCPTCGIHPFGEGPGPDGRTMAAVNVRCLDGVDLDTLHIEHYDGRAA